MTQSDPGVELPRKQSLKKDAAYVYGGYLLRYLGPLVLVPYYSHVLGPQGYGQVLAALALMTMVSVIVSYGFSYSGTRELASARQAHERTGIMARQMSGRVLLLPLALVTGVLGTYFSPVMHQNPWFGVFATLLGISNAFSFSWFFQGIRQFRTSIIFEVMAYPLNIIFVIGLVRHQSDGVYALAALLASSLICLVASFSYVRKSCAIGLASLRAGYEEIRDTTVFFITSMSFTILTVGSIYVLSLMSAPDEVGYYGAAERFISLGIGLLNPIGQVLMPTISSLHKDGAAHVHRLVRKGIFLEAGYGVAALIGGFIVAPWGIPLALGHAFLPSIVLFRIMLITMPFAAIKHALTLYILIPQHKEKYYLGTALVNLGVNLAAAFALAPAYGAEGMAQARLLSEIAATIFIVAACWRHGLLKNFWR